MSQVRLICASANALPLEDESVQCVVTSPPYWGLRQYAGEQEQVWGGDSACAHEWVMSAPEKVGRNDTDAASLARRAAAYNTGAGAGNIPPAEAIVRGGYCACGAWRGALGLEPTPELYVEHMVEVFREVRRVLRKDGTLWLNLGDSYAAGGTGGASDKSGLNGGRGVGADEKIKQGANIQRAAPTGLKPKDLVGIPWMVAFALRSDGWYLRSDIIWAKPNPMPESVTDRPTKAHEYLFLLSKSERYYYDAEAIREEGSGLSGGGFSRATAEAQIGHGAMRLERPDVEGRNKRTVWTIATRPYPGAHFATYPEDLVEPCILAGSSAKACGVCGAPWKRVTERGEPVKTGGGNTEGHADGPMDRGGNGQWDEGAFVSVAPRTTTGWKPTCEHTDDTGMSTVLDPFNGSGTTGRVAVRHGRSYIGVDISQEYLDEQAVKRIDRIQTVMPLSGGSAEEITSP